MNHSTALQYECNKCGYGYITGAHVIWICFDFILSGTLYFAKCPKLSSLSKPPASSVNILRILYIRRLLRRQKSFQIHIIFVD